MKLMHLHLGGGKLNDKHCDVCIKKMLISFNILSLTALNRTLDLFFTSVYKTVRQVDHLNSVPVLMLQYLSQYTTGSAVRCCHIRHREHAGHSLSRNGIGGTTYAILSHIHSQNLIRKRSLFFLIILHIDF